MKKIFFLFLLSCSGLCYGQIPFEKIYTLPGYALSGEKVIQDNDGNYMILANAWPGGSMNSGCLTKTDSLGNVLWAKLYTELYYEEIYFNHFVQTPDNSYLISGRASHTTSGRLLMMKVDSSGNILWSNCYGQGINSQNTGWCVQVLSDGDYLLGGAVGAGDMYLVKTDTAGNTLWSKTLGTGGYENAIGIDVAANGNFVVMGGEDIIGTTVAEFDNSGNLVWNKTYSLQNSYGLTQWAIEKCPDNGFAHVGVWHSDTSAVFWPYLLKSDSSGNLLWCKIYTQTVLPAMVGEFFDLRITSDGGFILTWEPEYPCQYCRTGLIKTDSFGNIEWAKNYTLNSYTFPGSAIQTSDSGYAIVGNNYSSNPRGIHFLKTAINGDTDCYDSTLIVVPVNVPVTVSTNGNIGTGHILNIFNPIATAVSVLDTNSCMLSSLSEPEIQNQTSGIKIFPNPAHQNITIEAQDLTSKKVEIKITDMLGQVLLISQENTFGGGNLFATINIENIASGIYFVIVSSGENNFCRKLIIE